MKDEFNVFENADEIAAEELKNFDPMTNKEKERLFTMSENKFKERKNNITEELKGIQVSGVEQYKRPKWRIPAMISAAAALVAVIGTSSFMMTRTPETVPDPSSEAVVTDTSPAFKVSTVAATISTSKAVTVITTVNTDTITTTVNNSASAKTESAVAKENPDEKIAAAEAEITDNIEKNRIEAEKAADAEQARIEAEKAAERARIDAEKAAAAEQARIEAEKADVEENSEYRAVAEEMFAKFEEVDTLMRCHYSEPEIYFNEIGSYAALNGYSSLQELKNHVLDVVSQDYFNKEYDYFFGGDASDIPTGKIDIDLSSDERLRTFVEYKGKVYAACYDSRLIFPYLTNDPITITVTDNGFLASKKYVYYGVRTENPDTGSYTLDIRNIDGKWKVYDVK